MIRIFLFLFFVCFLHFAQNSAFSMEAEKAENCIKYIESNLSLSDLSDLGLEPEFEHYLKNLENFFIELEKNASEFSAYLSKRPKGASQYALFRQYKHLKDLYQDYIEWVDLSRLGEEYKIEAENQISMLKQGMTTEIEELRRKIIELESQGEDSIILELEQQNANADFDSIPLILKSYLNFLSHTDLKMEVLDFLYSPSDSHVLKCVVLISGPNAFEYFRDEAGVHRFRYMKEKSDRKLENDIKVTVHADSSDAGFQFNDNLIEYHSSRASGPGGQHMQKSSTRITAIYPPLNLSVSIQATRSQHQNKSIAKKLLRTKARALLESNAQKSAQNYRAQQVAQSFGTTKSIVRLYDLINKVIIDSSTDIHIRNPEQLYSGQELQRIINRRVYQRVLGKIKSQ